MKIHEYQAKEILRKFGVPIPKGQHAFSIDEAEAAAKALIAETESEFVVVKAQIHAGGRGKGGGVKVSRAPPPRARRAQKILGMNLVTHQTGPGGQIVKRLLVEQGVDIARELYLGLSSTAAWAASLMASSEGGMEIEEVAAEHPEKILKRQSTRSSAWRPSRPATLAYGLGLHGAAAKNAAELILLALRGVHRDRRVAAGDQPAGRDRRTAGCWRSTPRSTFDDNALFRHKDLEALRDLDEEDPPETEAKRYDLSFIKLDGNIGCMVNGAGLAMATMDTIKHFGGAARELPRRRRRRHRGARDGSVQHHPRRPEGARHLRQHLRRDHEVRHHRRRASSPRSSRSGSRCRWSCAWRGPTWSGARRCWRSRGLAVTTATTWPTAPRRWSRSRPGRRRSHVRPGR